MDTDFSEGETLMDEYASSYAEFLTEHPEYLGEIRYATLTDSDEPQMMMTTTAMQAFIVWAHAKGYLRNAERVPDMLNLLRAFS